MVNDKAHPCTGKHRSMETILTAKNCDFKVAVILENYFNIMRIIQALDQD